MLIFADLQYWLNALHTKMFVNLQSGPAVFQACVADGFVYQVNEILCRHT